MLVVYKYYDADKREVFDEDCVPVYNSSYNDGDFGDLSEESYWCGWTLKDHVLDDIGLNKGDLCDDIYGLRELCGRYSWLNKYYNTEMIELIYK